MKRINRKPVMSDLRQSGSLEQDADYVVFLYCVELLDPDKAQENGTVSTDDEGVKHRIVEAIIAKARGSAIDTVKFMFTGDYQRYDALEIFRKPLDGGLPASFHA